MFQLKHNDKNEVLQPNIIFLPNENYGYLNFAAAVAISIFLLLFPESEKR
jgi:hypothetical protein